MSLRSQFRRDDSVRPSVSHAASLRIITVIAILAIVGVSSKLAFAAVSFSGDTVFGTQTFIGNSGFGTFRIDGGSVYAPQQVSTISIGGQASGNGIATVTGLGSQWTIQSSIDVGVQGIGRLEILNGGVVSLSQPSFGFRIASQTPSVGTVVVDGTGSVLNMNTALSMGSSPTTSGSALLRVSNGGIVNSTSGQSQISLQGRVELDGGLLRVSSLSNNGVIIGSGELNIQATSGTTNAGRIEAGEGDLLRISGQSSSGMQNQGVIVAEGGEIEFARPLTNVTPGQFPAEISLRDGVIRVGGSFGGTGQLTNSALLAATGGLNDFYGRVENIGPGQIAVTNQSVLVFHDDVTANSGTVVVFPGSSAVFLEDLTMSGSSVLLADLAGTDDDTGFGQIEVVGTAQLNGSLNVTLAEEFTPQAGDSFSLVAASGINGSLALGDVADLPAGLMWDLSGDEHHVVLSVVPGLAGDYNGDGAVDGGDYVVWRQTLNQTGSGLAADGNDNGVVDAGDFEFWRSRYGDLLASGSGAATVPEPATALSIFVGLTIVLGRRWMVD
jgi:T5SS/PEP-CTERM-associated repeat protein